MKAFDLLTTAACVVLAPNWVFAQQASNAPVYVNNCLKVNPDKNSEFRQWARETLHKYAQYKVDSGELKSWTLLRAVLPRGTQNSCDYMEIGVFSGMPPKPTEPKELSDQLKKAGLSMDAEQYAQNERAVSELAETGMFQTLASIGRMQKGDYLLINFDKITDVGKWIDIERRLWQPIAEVLVKEGTIRGWMASARYVPDGPAMHFDALTVDVYPSWDGYFRFEANPRSLELWRQVHPDTDINIASANYASVITRVSRELWVVEDMIGAK
ncbi:hypothetical protein [Acidicapsa ligni]|uniref:hypothetical protein n=1 Tax=Acidicapsa ligni TaxID=542300 RepID=UPI0021DF44A0|nr:hypothetical protein [Acidicapsa ligni]